MKVDASLTGKHIITYRPKGNKKYSPEEISQYLRKFQLCKAIQLIGELSFQNLFKSPVDVPEIKGVPIHDGILAYLSMQLVKSSNDYRSQVMQVDDLLKAIDMYFGLTDPILEDDKDNINGFFVRFGATQFDYVHSLRTNLFARTLIIYSNELWLNIEKTKGIVINNTIENIVGLNLKEILAFTTVFCGMSSSGFFHFIESNESFPTSWRNIITQDKQTKFINWIASGYKEFRKAYDSSKPIKIEYEKSRFNPLIRKPVLIPDRNLTQGNYDIFLTPIPRLLYLRSTYGLYFELADFFKGESGANSFRSGFGYVFQEYVGLLLKNSLLDKNIKSELKYGTRQELKDTPDWFIIDGKRAILIEVKQSCLHLKAKSWGDVATIREDLKKSIGSGAKQIFRFRNDVTSGRYNELNFLSDIEAFEHLIVTYDRSYFLNSALRQQIRQILPELSADYHWHTISIDEFEYFLPLAGSNIFKFLEKKRLDLNADNMDFKEYSIQEFPDCNWSNPYLNKVYEDFFSSLDIILPTEISG